MRLFKVEFQYDHHTETYVLTEGCDLKNFIEQAEDGCTWVNVQFNDDLKCNPEHELDWTNYDLKHLYPTD